MFPIWPIVSALPFRCKSCLFGSLVAIKAQGPRGTKTDQQQRQNNWERKETNEEKTQITYLPALLQKLVRDFFVQGHFAGSLCGMFLDPQNKGSKISENIFRKVLMGALKWGLKATPCNLCTIVCNCALSCPFVKGIFVAK